MTKEQYDSLCTIDNDTIELTKEINSLFEEIKGVSNDEKSFPIAGLTMLIQQGFETLYTSFFAAFLAKNKKSFSSFSNV